MMVESLGPLNKCPECGQTPAIFETTETKEGQTIGAVACHNCSVVATAATTQGAIEIWNTLKDLSE